MLAGRTTYTAPKTPEELATFKEDYPDVYDVVETVAHLRATEQLSGLQEEVARLSEKESSSNRRAAEQELLNVHPDFRTIRDSEDFHDWARVQPEAIQDWVYKNTGDSRNTDDHRGILLSDHAGKAMHSMVKDKIEPNYVAHMPVDQHGAVAKRGTDFASHFVTSAIAVAHLPSRS